MSTTYIHWGSSGTPFQVEYRKSSQKSSRKDLFVIVFLQPTPSPIPLHSFPRSIYLKATRWTYNTGTLEEISSLCIHLLSRLFPECTTHHICWQFTLYHRLSKNPFIRFVLGRIANIREQFLLAVEIFFETRSLKTNGTWNALLALSLWTEILCLYLLQKWERKERRARRGKWVEEGKELAAVTFRTKINLKRIQA